MQTVLLSQNLKHQPLSMTFICASVKNQVCMRKKRKREIKDIKIY